MASHLTLEEREIICHMHRTGKMQVQIADRLGRSKSTISRELRRNRSRNGYWAVAAQRKAERRRSERPWVAKMEQPEVRRYVQQRLRWRWSPDTIDDRGATLDAYTAGDFAAFFHFRSLSAQPPQESLPLPAFGVFGANPGVDRLVRDLPPPVPGEVAARASRDGVGRPTLSQPLLHIPPHFRPLELRNPRSLAAPPPGLSLGRYRPVAVPAAIASQLAGNRALVAAKPLGNLRLHLSSPMHVGYDLTLFQGKMTCHRGDSFRMGPS